MKSSGIGGQAVLEGIMMKNGDSYAVAVRNENNEITLKVDEYHLFSSRRKWASKPVIRGVFNFIDSMVLGVQTLMYSASIFDDEQEEEEKSDGKENLFMAGTVILSVVLAVGIFMVLPTVLSHFFERFISSSVAIAALEGIFRVIIFLVYVAGISLMRDIQRVYMYHGAEHKCINCVEHGMELNVDNVMKSSRYHKRCGTSFLLFVIIISVILFIIIRVDNIWLRILSRIILVPVIAGLSYEVIRLAGNSDNRFVNIISKPGLWLQRLTTREPDESMVEVAIEAVEAVFDWKQYLAENF